MAHPHDTRPSFRWEEEREREDGELEREGRFWRRAGDPRWGTGGSREAEIRPGRQSDLRRRGIGDDGRRRPGDRTSSEPVDGSTDSVDPSTDERIARDVRERIVRCAGLDAREITVIVSGAEVMLTGVVSTRSQKRLAETVVEGADGVVDVHNRLRLSVQ